MAKVRTDVSAELARKLHPEVFKTGPQFHAMLACLLGQRGWTEPEYASLCVTSDNFLLGMQQGDCGFNDFIGSLDDLVRNADGACDAVGATDDERAYLHARIQACRTF